MLARAQKDLAARERDVDEEEMLAKSRLGCSKNFFIFSTTEKKIGGKNIWVKSMLTSFAGKKISGYIMFDLL